LPHPAHPRRSRLPDPRAITLRLTQMEWSRPMKPDRTRTDEQLIEQFVSGSPDESESAFEALLRSHGPLVMGVCRQVLGQFEDAEDAFQETFLVLARKAGTIRNPRALASWLYEVAYRVAIRARVKASRHRRGSARADEMFSAEDAEREATRNELRITIHSE